MSTLGAVARCVVEPSNLRPRFVTARATDAALVGVAGQQRAREAIAFGLAMKAERYHVAVSGPPLSGRSLLVHELVDAAAQSRPAGRDWVYLNNFVDPRRPRAFPLPAGMAVQLRKLLDGLVSACRTRLPEAFSSAAYEARTKQALATVTQTRSQLIETLVNGARAFGFVINATPYGFMAIPAGPNGEAMEPAQFATLPESVREPLEKTAEQVQEMIGSTLRQLRNLDAEAHATVARVDEDVTLGALAPSLEELTRLFEPHGLGPHLDSVRADLASNVSNLKRFFTAQPDLPSQVLQQLNDERDALLKRYIANVIVSREHDTHAPVEDERDPLYWNIFGRVEIENRFGTFFTDFTHIRPGAVHLANDGYLLLQAEDLFGDPRSWLKLKRVLKTGEVRFDDGLDGMPVPFAGLTPEGIKLDLKVILVGPPGLFAVLDAVDPQFGELFQVRAEFEPDQTSDGAAAATYAAFVRRTSEERGLRHFDDEAVAGVLYFGSRMAGRQDRLTTRLGVVAQICQEADLYAGLAGATMVGAAHVRAAMRARDRRSSLIPDRLREMIHEGVLRIQTSGQAVGQVNGLAVFGVNNREFGIPMRITCRTGAGRGGVVAIDRETERSGAIHTKGVLVLQGYLMGTFGRRGPLAFNASLTFEQSYDEVEGDSASSAELYAILTSIAEVPVRQDVAVTGSIDQFGNIQAVGGITQKVEGFFDVCREAGLSGSQGVVVPRSNLVNLILREDVVEAVEAGQFHIWAVTRVEEGLEILTGIPAGEILSFGAYPQGTVFARVASNLAELRRAAAPEDGIAAGLAAAAAAERLLGRSPQRASRPGSPRN